jgi:predicted nucleic acid-binding protein
MRRYLLDTGPLSALLHARPGAVTLMTGWVRNQEAATSSLVYGEVIEHILGRPNYALHQRALRGLLRGVHPYFPTFGILERYASLRRQLRPPTGPGLIGDIDTLIAATALEHNLTVVTLDGDFQRVPGLPVLLLTRRELV